MSASSASPLPRHPSLEAGAEAGPELADAPAEVREVIEAQARCSG